MTSDKLHKELSEQFYSFKLDPTINIRLNILIILLDLQRKMIYVQIITHPCI